MRRLTLIGVLLALVGLGVAGFLWVDSYQPLVRGTGSLYPQTAKDGIGIQGKIDDYRHGKPFRVGVSLVNSGHFTVRVTNVEPWSPLLGPTRLYMGAKLQNPFHPFDLAPGKQAFVGFKGVYRAHCHPVQGGGTGWGNGGFEVQYKFLWRTGRAEIALPEPLYQDPPRGEDCTRHGFSG